MERLTFIFIKVGKLFNDQIQKEVDLPDIHGELESSSPESTAQDLIPCVRSHATTLISYTM